ncbi:MAG: hypothetical protein OES09_10355, partial [Gammaproteobacteria bacterium]|nr:hypothetical protein [Gammaproteobacteria bacterium]
MRRTHDPLSRLGSISPGNYQQTRLLAYTSLMNWNRRGPLQSWLGTVAGILLLPGCDFESSDNFPNVPAEGLVVAVEANQHEDSDEVQIAAAVFRDGEPVNLVAGDVFKAVSGANEVLLLKRGNYKGSYAATLSADDLFSISIVHEPVDARDSRWYPVDVINVDPGPGELVGPAASVVFPPRISITGPTPLSVYTQSDETIDLTWVALNQDDTIKVRSAVNCSDGLATNTYGTELLLGDDDGLESITIDDFIYDSASESPGLSFIVAAARAMLQQLLNDLSAGNIDPDFFSRRDTANPINSACDRDKGGRYHRQRFRWFRGAAQRFQSYPDHYCP